MDKWLLILSGIIFIAVIITVLIGQARESAKVNALTETWNVPKKLDKN